MCPSKLLLGYGNSDDVEKQLGENAGAATSTGTWRSTSITWAC